MNNNGVLFPKLKKFITITTKHVMTNPKTIGELNVIFNFFFIRRPSFNQNFFFFIITFTLLIFNQISHNSRSDIKLAKLGYTNLVEINRMNDYHGEVEKK